MIDYKKFVENSRKWLSQYIKDNHLQSLVIGVSGGIDSTVSCAIASSVCEKLNIPLIGRSLPTETNSSSENNIAELVGDAFCSDFKVISISSAFRAIHQLCYEGECKDHSRVINNISNLQDGNIKARLRMIYLYNLASIHRGCVLDTDNKTEHELGFWTIHGDVGDLNCGLIYLWKTEVYELAKFLYDEYKINKNVEQAKAIYESTKLTPTDGNGVMSGGDCAQFGLDSYDQVDDVLKTMYFPENGMDNIKYKEEYIRLIDLYNEQGVDKIMSLHQNSMFKRQPLPISPTKKELEL